MKPACLEGGSTYDGRRLAVCHQTGAHNKVLIPINPLEGIYAFPTHSPKVHECNWIFYHHGRTFEPHPKNPNKSIITFKNNLTLTLVVSHHTMKKQMHHAAYCVIRFSHHYPNNTLGDMKHDMLV
ncbi:competence protein ComK [Bacillus sp. EB106-08-02-XG196]|uniref:competence protein ComK n=1 Tax=Bacillus sp. EB106-08-02-XG196 TaxID=2737049 RepID=UPI0034D17779